MFLDDEEEEDDLSDLLDDSVVDYDDLLNIEIGIEDQIQIEGT
jgi:hypothetical protein